jgi:hypothetical protein
MNEIGSKRASLTRLASLATLSRERERGLSALRNPSPACGRRWPATAGRMRVGVTIRSKIILL